MITGAGMNTRFTCRPQHWLVSPTRSGRSDSDILPDTFDWTHFEGPHADMEGWWALAAPHALDLSVALARLMKASLLSARVERILGALSQIRCAYVLI
jgi:hypothetical protein